jgi:hypothetical protein
LAAACDLADRCSPGTLVWARHADVLDFAVVLAPEEALKTARRAFLLGMCAVADALASVCPPEKRVSFDWPDTLRFDGARLGGGQLAWPAGVDEDEQPSWLVFSATLLASKRDAGDPGYTPDSTSLEEEHCAADEQHVLIERFARYLLLGFDSWTEQGFDSVADAYLRRLNPRPKVASLAENGDLIYASGRDELATALRTPGWLDPATGKPRL